MKMIMAVIKPFKLDEVREALTGIGVNGLTATDVQGFGKQRGHEENGNSGDYDAMFLPKVKIEVAVTDDMADKAVDVIKDVGNTGRIGDGKIFVYNIERAVRIRTSEEGEDVL